MMLKGLQCVRPQAEPGVMGAHSFIDTGLMICTGLIFIMVVTGYDLIQLYLTMRGLNTNQLLSHR